jgi:GxxExxY protein
MRRLKYSTTNPNKMIPENIMIKEDVSWIVSEKESDYSEQHYPLKRETFELIGIAMEVHNYLGNGFAEDVYKDALQEEFQKRRIDYEREKKYTINYKGIILPHFYYADFVISNKIILEVKSQAGIHEAAIPQVVNYLAASKLNVGLIINFGEGSLKYKRVIFSRKNRGE